MKNLLCEVICFALITGVVPFAMSADGVLYGGCSGSGAYTVRRIGGDIPKN